MKKHVMSENQVSVGFNTQIANATNVSFSRSVGYSPSNLTSDIRRCHQESLFAFSSPSWAVHSFWPIKTVNAWKYTPEREKDTWATTAGGWGANTDQVNPHLWVQTSWCDQRSRTLDLHQPVECLSLAAGWKWRKRSTSTALESNISCTFQYYYYYYILPLSILWTNVVFPSIWRDCCCVN